MPGDRLLAAAASMIFISLVPASAAVAAAPPLPDGFTWVDRAPGAASAVLHRVGAGGAVHDQRLDFAVNAIGCTGNGTVFGLADARRGVHLAGGPHLLRIDAAGAVRDLGAVGTAGLRYPLAEGYAGTVRSGRLVVASGGVLREVPLDTSRPAVTRSANLPALPYVGDWVLDPGTGELDALVGAGRHAALVRLAPRTLAPTSTPLSGLPGGDGYGGVAWTPGNVLYAVRNDAHGAGAVYRVPLGKPADAQLVRRTGPAVSSDAAWCEPDIASVASVPTPVHQQAPVLPVLPPPPPPVAQPTPTRPSPSPSPSAAPSRRPAVVVPPPAPPAASPSYRPLRMVVKSHLVAPRRSVVSKRMIPVVGGAMVAVVVAIRTTRMARSRK